MGRVAWLLLGAAVLVEMSPVSFQVVFNEGVKTIAKAIGPHASLFVLQSLNQTWTRSEESFPKDTARFKVQSLEEEVADLKAELAKMTNLRQEESFQKDMASSKAMEKQIADLEAELEKAKTTNLRQEAALAELLSNITALQATAKAEVLGNQRPTGVFVGHWGNIAKSIYTSFSMTMDSSTFRYIYETGEVAGVTGSIKYTVTQHRHIKRLGMTGFENFEGIWDVTTQTIVGHGVSVSDSSILGTTSTYVMSFRDNSVLVWDPQATTRLTKDTKK